METPEELLGQEPSLVELLKHHNDNKELYEDINADYLKNTRLVIPFIWVDN